jgi:uncharacterized repeat protein (TIGR03843 family)
VPEDERSARAADVTGATGAAAAAPEPASPHVLNVLSAGELEVEGRLPWSSNYTFLVTARLDGEELRAVYKPGRGERRLWDFPPDLYEREVAAFRLSENLGLHVVPETVLRADAPFGDGSLQRFVDADFSEHYFTLLETAAHAEALRTIAAFDLVLNNADRKGGHCLLGPDERIWGIDHGLCFHPEPKLRTVMWDFAGEPLPTSVIDACGELSHGRVPDDVGELLTAGERTALVKRAKAIVADGVFPEPPVDSRAYPWPLV